MARKKKRVATFDFETDPFKYGRTPEPFACGFYTEDDYQVFWGSQCATDFVDYIKDEDDLIIYAHNGGKFDFFYLLDWFDADLMIINGRIAKATMFNGRVEFRDSFLIIPVPLAQFEKDKIEYWKFEREHRERHKVEILRYMRKDCSALFELVDNFVRTFGSGLTLAGTAFRELKKTGYKPETTYEHYDDRLRPFYFGGRVQCFEVGEHQGPLDYVDINSAYPYAMTFPHWFGADRIEHLKMPDTDNGSWFAEITAVSRGALPFRHENKLYFPDDNKKRRYRASGWEILAGQRTGTLDIYKIHLVHKPRHTKNFKEYVDKFFAMKLDAERRGDPIARLFAKILLNACYGKFGQDGRKFEKFKICDFGEWPDGADWEPYADTVTGHAIYSRPDPSDRFYNVATAASVTAFVRAYLWEAIHSSERPLYCDTDSLVCARFTGEIGDSLGQWDREARINKAYIAQRKMYGFEVYKGDWPFVDYKTASKGVRLTYQQIKEGVLSGKNIVSERDAPAFSLKYGARFFKRETNFSNLAQNSLTPDNLPVN